MKRRGQSLVESTLVLLVFFSLLLGVIDVAQVLFAHQSLVERVNQAVRWASVHEWQGADPIRNLILYNRTDEPLSTTAGYLGLKPENIQVIHKSDDPEEELLTVAIVDFQSHLFSPWIARTLVSPRPVLVSTRITTAAPKQ